SALARALCRDHPAGRATPPPMTVARRLGATRAFLASAAILVAAIVWLALPRINPAIAALASVALLVWWRSVFSTRRVVLWLEERLPELRYSLAALADEPETRFRPVLESRVRDARFAKPLALAGLRLVGIPLAFLVLVRAGTMMAKPAATRLAPLVRSETPLSAIVTPPSYARLATDTLTDPTTISALVGSDLRFSGRLTNRSTMPRQPTVLRLGDRAVALEPWSDSAPRVVLELPAHDSVLPAQLRPIQLTASVHDAIGLASAWF